MTTSMHRLQISLPQWQVQFLAERAPRRCQFAPSDDRHGRNLRVCGAHRRQPRSAEGERDTWAAFRKYDDKAWSYTDCAIFALARRLKVAEVFAFDSHFDQMPGIIRVP